MAVDDDSEEDFEANAEFRQIQRVNKPTAQQVQQHEDENHAVYRNWCEVCVASRGLGQQKRRDKRALAEKAKEGPKVCSDYFLCQPMKSQLRWSWQSSRGAVP